MKIALLTLGTRGDVQPYAELAKALNAKGLNDRGKTIQFFRSPIQVSNHTPPFFPTSRQSARSEMPVKGDNSAKEVNE
ncbi:MAG: hypothetical protein KF856_05555 [Cyclobacteriaceae bacterium]|jgi:hypothetical protein|nr:hypothetical protein [Cyclobacteriaceae bacterium]